MATAKPIRSPQRRPRPRRYVLLPVAALVALAVWFGPGLRQAAQLAAAESARQACSCRHVTGRTLNQCRADLGPGAAFVDLRENEELRSVIARVPLLSGQRASFRDGEGCLLEPWGR